MTWLIYLAAALVICAVVVLACLFIGKRSKLKARAKRFGVCANCSVSYDTRRKLEYLRKSAGGGMFQQCDVWVTEVFCPKCGTVKESDRAEAMRRAEQETVW